MCERSTPRGLFLPFIGISLAAVAGTQTLIVSKIVGSSLSQFYSYRHHQKIPLHWKKADEKMHEQGSVESSLDSTASWRLEYESDLESIESIPRRRKKSGHGRCDASTESTMHSLEDSDHFSCYASDDDEDDKSITIHDIQAVVVEGHLNSSILSKSYHALVVNAMEEHHRRGATSLGATTTKSISCETDILSSVESPLQEEGMSVAI